MAGVSTSYKFGVNRARDGGAGRAVDQRPAVGEECESQITFGQWSTQEKIAGCVHAEVFGDGREVDFCVGRWADLDGVAAAEGDGGLGGGVQELEIPLAAGGAIRAMQPLG